MTHADIDTHDDLVDAAMRHESEATIPKGHTEGGPVRIDTRAVASRIFWFALALLFLLALPGLLSPAHATPTCWPDGHGCCRVLTAVEAAGART